MQLRNKIIALLGLNIFNYIEATGRYQAEDPMTTVEGNYEDIGQSNNDSHLKYLSPIAFTSAALLGLRLALEPKSGNNISTQPIAEGNKPMKDLEPEKKEAFLKIKAELNNLTQNHCYWDNIKGGETIGFSNQQSQSITRKLCEIVSSMKNQSNIFNRELLNNREIFGGMQDDNRTILDRICFLLSYAIKYAENFSNRMNKEWYQNCKTVFEYICNNYENYDIPNMDNGYRSIKSLLKDITHSMLTISSDDYNDNNFFNNINNSGIVSLLLEQEYEEQKKIWSDLEKNDPENKNTRSRDVAQKRRIQLRDLVYSYLTNILDNSNTREQDLATGGQWIYDSNNDVDKRKRQFFNCIVLLNVYRKLIGDTTNREDIETTLREDIVKKINTVFNLEIMLSLHQLLMIFIGEMRSVSNVNQQAKKYMIDLYQEYQNTLEYVLSFNKNNQNSDPQKPIESNGTSTWALRISDPTYYQNKEPGSNIYKGLLGLRQIRFRRK